ncbi:bifunctional nuclease family protein [Actinomycetospora sp. TBRC 11914]|uniref:bifunctional nuclease family protein n=1 Tax=Actinomycetospora sp. TBRC 11914 TaxID=2729387 RepID=UPI00145CB4CA|nr:bifunctional nuclease family protein [Actinomycetospora sp. TBRC 11914]NMO89466.1 bifunctional nuclease family protein [Actinomycetospora sp. TBRC 11914]
MKPVDLVGLHVEAMSGSPVVIVREHDAPHRVVPIFVGGAEAASIAVALSGQRPPRPLTHDLMVALVAGLGAQLDRVEVTALRDGAFLAELAVSGPDGPRRLDARPSDGIALAVRVGAPLYVSEDVLDEAGTVLAEQPAEEDIDQVVADFRTHLDRLDPDALAAAIGDPPEGPGPDPSGPDEEPPERRD